MDRTPAVFLSSTYFDLRQVRADVASFVETSLGYRLLASEFPAFPVDAALDTIENCRKRVEDDADILVLIIGARYGQVPDGGSQSVTNIEYSVARAKRIPIFAFVQRDVLSLVPLWHANPSADFSSTIDNTKLFEFIRDIRDVDRVWMFPFETAQDIIAALRTQVSYEVARGLQLSARMRGAPEATRGLTGEALRIALQRKTGWPGLLLACLVDDEVHQAGGTRRDHAGRLKFSAGERVAEADVLEWLQTFTTQALRIIDSLKILVEQLLNDAFNSADVGAIVYGAKQVGIAYRACLEWGARLRCASVPEDWREVVAAKAQMLDLFLAELETFGTKLRGAIDTALANSDDSDEPLLVKVTFNLNTADMSSFYDALESLRVKRGLS